MLKIIIKLTALVLLFGISSRLIADTGISDEPVSELWLNYAQDEEDAIDYSLELNIGLTMDDSLLLAAGQSESELLTETIITNQFVVGYSTIRLAPWANTVFYEYWGKANELVIESLNYDVSYFAPDWSAGFDIEYRKIDFFTRELSLGQRRYEVDSYGVGVHSGIINGPWRWSANARWYDYSEDIRWLNTVRGLFLLGLKNLDHASSLNSWSAASKLNYRFNTSGVGVGYTYAVAEIDRAEATTLALLYDFKLTKSVMVDIELGRTFEDGDIETDSGSISLGFLF